MATCRRLEATHISIMTVTMMIESSEIRTARTEGRPTVVLESTVITHGLPWPENLQTALAMEAAVREAGAVPATIAILDGVIRIGLEPNEIERVARFAGGSGQKDEVGKDERAITVA